MKTTTPTNYMELYTDYLIRNNGLATATGLSAMMNNEVSHVQITRFLASDEFDSKHLWLKTKKIVQEIESEDGCLIFDETVQEGAWSDASEMMCYHFDHTKGKNVKGLNILDALYYANDAAIPVAFEIIRNPIWYCELDTKQEKRKSTVTKNELIRQMVQTCVANQL